MSDELSEPSYSAFWPVLILVAAFTISNFYQLYERTAHWSAVNHQIATNKPIVAKAQAAQDRLVALLKDLVATAQKDPNAAQIMREVTQAGIVRERQNPPATSTNTPAANP